MRNYNVTVIPGDGIGPEIVREAVKVLDAAGKKYGYELNYTEILMGGCSIDEYGVPLTDEVRFDAYKKAYEFFKDQRREDGLIIFECGSWLLYEGNKEIFGDNIHARPCFVLGTGADRCVGRGWWSKRNSCWNPGSEDGSPYDSSGGDSMARWHADLGWSELCGRKQQASQRHFRGVCGFVGGTIRK